MIHIHNPLAVIELTLVLLATFLLGLHRATGGRIWKTLFRVFFISRRSRWAATLGAFLPLGAGFIPGLFSGPPAALQLAARVLILTLGMLLLVCVLYGMLKKRYERMQIQRYLREIDGVRGGIGRSAARRIRSCILELNRKGVTAIDLSRCCLKGRDLRSVRLYHADLRQADLEGAVLKNASLTGAKLQHADLRGADLRDTFLVTANLQQADLSYADLRQADLREADLRGARLDHAVLTGARLDKARLRDASLCHARLQNAGVTAKQLMTAQTLYQASLDPKIRGRVLARQDRLLDDPQSCVWMQGIVQLF